MIAEERQQIILSFLDEHGMVTVNDLVAQFDVSEMTIRRDLDLLERRGLLRRVHGGAVSARGRSYEPPLLTRSAQNPAAKQKIGKAAANLIRTGDSITLDIGTTTLEIARNLGTKQDLTIITPSFLIASELINHQGIRIILTGGILRPGELSMVGHLAERIASDFFVDKFFLGAGAVDRKAGITEFNLEDALVKRALLRSAKEVILVADSSKFNQVAFTLVAPISAVHHVVTDSDIDPDIVVWLQEQGIQITIA